MTGEANELRSERSESQITWGLVDHCILSGRKTQLLEGFEQIIN